MLLCVCAAEPDLSCLDHGYFLAEVSRLTSRAQSVQSRLLRDAYGSGRKAGHHHEQSISHLHEVVAMLDSYRHSLQQEVRFEPQELLTDLYKLDRMVTSLQTGSSEGLEELHLLQQHHNHAHCDDYYDEHSWAADPDDDYDYDYHDHDCNDFRSSSSISQTPGRRPPHRNARSSGGGGPNSQAQCSNSGSRQRTFTRL
eukprot:jgi/Chrzof1/13881/Cz08g15310.t1